MGCEFTILWLCVCNQVIACSCVCGLKQGDDGDRFLDQLKFLQNGSGQEMSFNVAEASLF